MPIRCSVKKESYSNLCKEQHTLGSSNHKREIWHSPPRIRLAKLIGYWCEGYQVVSGHRKHKKEVGPSAWNVNICRFHVPQKFALNLGRFP
jgi:hypothetical protein